MRKIASAPHLFATRPNLTRITVAAARQAYDDACAANVAVWTGVRDAGCWERWAATDLAWRGWLRARGVK